MTNKEKIRKEVERLRNLHQMKYQQLDLDADSSLSLVECGKRNLCNELLSFIDSLQEEPVSEDLEEAAKKAATQFVGGEEKFFWNDYHKFKAGANWQKQNMMKDGAKGEVIAPLGRKLIEHEAVVCPGKMATPFPVEIMEKFNAGDKVKIIIAKED